MFEDISVEFDFKVGANTSPASLSSFDVGQFDSKEQILFFIQKQNKYLVRIQELLKILRRKAAETKARNRSQAEMATMPLFDREISKVEGFVMACKLYVRIRMRETTIEDQVQWVLIYV